MLKNERLLHQLYWVLLSCFSGMILLADYLTPTSIATGVLYVLPVISSTFLFGKKKELLAVLFAMTCLIFVGFGLSEEAPKLWVALLNRGLSLFITWASALICYMAIDVQLKTQADEERFQISLDAAPNGMVMINQEGQILVVNKQIETTFGYTREELLGQTIETLVPQRFRKAHPEHRSAFFKAPLARFMGAGRDLYGITKSGDEVPVEIGLNPIAKEGGTVVLASIIDITERKNLEEQGKRLAAFAVEEKRAEELQVAYEELKLKSDDVEISAERDRSRLFQLNIATQKMEKVQIASLNIMKDLERRRKEVEAREAQLQDTQKMLIEAEKMGVIGQMAAGVAHQIKNPLGIMSQAGDLIAREVKASKNGLAQAAVESIFEAITRTDKIVKSLMNLGRRQESIKKRPCDIHPVLDEAVALVEREATMNGIKIVKDYQKNAPRVLVDANQMEHVFINLIHNATEAMPKGGELTLQTFEAGLLDTLTGPEKKNEFFSCTISDTGFGISNEAMLRVGEPFFTTKLAGKGTGLGLSVTKSIVESMEGFVTIESVLGKGTSVSVLLPIAKKGELHGEKENPAH